MDSVFEKAVDDFYNGRFEGELLIHNTYGNPDVMPLEVYLREEAELSDLEDFALELCHGHVLDVGAGLGALTTILQGRGFTVDALELSNRFCQIMHKQGVEAIVNDNFLSHTTSKRYDTLLLMMNGFGLCGTFSELPGLFKALDRHLLPGGQVIFDSSDLEYLYVGTAKPADRYYGEMDYRYEYRGEFGDWFNWLYIDSETLALEAAKYDFDLQVLYTEESGQYVGRLTRS